MKLNSITVENFKVFKNKTTFPLSKINLMTGINGRGKSTLLQSILLLRQSFVNDHLPDRLLLNGECVNLGNFDDIRNIALSKQITLIYNLIDGGEASIVVGEDGIDNMIAKIIDGNNIQNLNIFQNTHYIAADRIGPQEFYIKSTIAKFLNVGTKGEFTGNVLLQKKTDLVNETLCIKEKNVEGYTREISQELETQVGEWLSKILDTPTKVEVKDVGNRVIILSFKFGNNPKEYKPNNVGFGFSYILPIVVSCLIAKESEFLVIENPEAHLHPKAQFELIDLISKVAQCGVQVFIESHSEHILNALRVSIAKNIINNSDVSVLFFQDNEEIPVRPIPIDISGGIDIWPGDFFDQTEIALKQILGF